MKPMQTDDHNADDPDRQAQPTIREVTLHVDVDDLHELAHVERRLRATDVPDVLVHVQDNGASISFATQTTDGHYRGKTKAALANELAATSAWTLATIKDDLVTETGRTDSMLDVDYTPPEEGDAR